MTRRARARHYEASGSEYRVGQPELATHLVHVRDLDWTGVELGRSCIGEEAVEATLGEREPHNGPRCVSCLICL